MQLNIEKSTLVDDIKKAFTNCYPFLKLELYKKQPAAIHSIKKEPVAFNLPLVHVMNAGNKKKRININKDITVEALENEFEAIGLTAEIFRLSGNVLVETVLTRNWTLNQQNEEAMEISKHFTAEKKTLPGTA